MDDQRTFHQRLHDRQSRLDIKFAPKTDTLPAYLLERYNDPFIFLTTYFEGVIAETKGLAASYRFDVASFASFSIPGFAALANLCSKVRTLAPGALLIVDLRVSSGEGWAKFVFDTLKADAVTAIPSFGIYPLAPFRARPDKGLFLNCSMEEQIVLGGYNGCGHVLDVAKFAHVRDLVGPAPVLLEGVSLDNLKESVGLLWRNGKCEMLASFDVSALQGSGDPGPEFPTRIAAAAGTINQGINNVLKTMGAVQA